MARTKKFIDVEDKPKKGVSYEEIKPSKPLPYNVVDYLFFTDVYHYLRPYLDRELPKITRKELIQRYPKNKKITGNVWDCVYELKLKWPDEMVHIVLEK